jgi:hypothetical protein
MHRKFTTAVGAVLAASALVALSLTPAEAYAPTPQPLYQLPANTPCLKGQSNCVVYPKAAQLPDGRLVASFENSAVPASGTAIGQTLPVYKSDDHGTTWQSLSSVQAPVYMSSDPSVAKYTSNWTNPYLYTLPQDVGNLKKGTLLLASVVSGQDDYYTEHKAADPAWTPSNDGDRQDVAIALYSSTNDGTSWNFVNIIATGGWQGGSAGAVGQNISAANTSHQVDPVWEPYLMVYNNQLVAFYSDENDYTGYDPTTGVGAVDPNNATAVDSGGQVVAHRTWDGVNSSWSQTVIDVSGTTVDMGSGKTEIGGGRPGMANVVPTTDGKWMLTYEYWGGGANVHFKMANSPLSFFSDGSAAGTDISNADGSQGPLPYAAGSRGLSWGGSPVLVKLADGSIAYNAASSGDIWINKSGSSTGVWTQMHTTLNGAYSRNLTYDQTTGRLVVLAGAWGTSNSTPLINYGEVDLGNSQGTYYRLVNRKTGQVMGTSGRINDDEFNNWTPDVALENAGSAANPDTEYWHLTTKSDGGLAILNKSGGRALEPWANGTTAGTRLSQWVDDKATSLWTLVSSGSGYYKLQLTTNTGMYATAASSGTYLTLQAATSDHSQDWQLVPAP